MTRVISSDPRSMVREWSTYLPDEANTTDEKALRNCMKLQHAELTDTILKAFFKVYNTLGYGFLERVYENAMVIELQKAGLKVETQQRIVVNYEGKMVGDYCADLIVADRVIVELKAAGLLDQAHEAQLLNYLRATDIEVGLLLNFGARPEFKRKAYSNERKGVRAKPEASEPRE